MKALEMTALNPPKQSSQSWEGAFWTFDAVEERLIEAMLLWRRSPGGGKWPFAGDAPWQLMTRATRIEEGGFKGRDRQLRMQAEDAEEAQRMEGRERWGALNRDEVERRDEASEWLGWIGEESRKVVVLALTQRARGGDQVDWARIRLQLGLTIGRFGMYRRYTRAITAIVKRLNGNGSSHPC
jgi:hypothetical protein